MTRPDVGGVRVYTELRTAHFISSALSVDLFVIVFVFGLKYVTNKMSTRCNNWEAPK